VGILASELTGPVGGFPSFGEEKFDKRMDRNKFSSSPIISVAHTEIRSHLNGRGKIPSRAGALGFGVQNFEITAFN
jgi:hypothetical protein